MNFETLEQKLYELTAVSYTHLRHLFCEEALKSGWFELYYLGG